MQVADSTWLVLSVVSNGRAPAGCQATGVTKIARSVIAPLAEHHVSVLMLSTYQTDFILVSAGRGRGSGPAAPGAGGLILDPRAGAGAGPAGGDPHAGGGIRHLQGGEWRARPRRLRRRQQRLPQAQAGCVTLSPASLMPLGPRGLWVPGVTHPRATRTPWDAPAPTGARQHPRDAG